MIGIVNTRASGATGLTRSRTHLGATLDFHITLPRLLMGWKPKSWMIPNHPNMKIHNHHNKQHGSNIAKTIIMGSNVAKIQKLNVEDRIASTPTGPWKKTYPHVFS
jgi:hypothetical protein